MYAPPDPDDGVRVLITRFYPRGVRGERFEEWRRELSPGPALLKQYKAVEISDGEFVKRFKAEMDTDACKHAMEELRVLATKGDVTLMLRAKW